MLRRLRGFFGPSKKELRAEIERLKAANAEVEKSWDSIDHFNNAIDNQISESLEKIGEFPGKPAGMPDRIDVACRLLEWIPGLKAEIGLPVVNGQKTTLRR